MRRILFLMALPVFARAELNLNAPELLAERCKPEAVGEKTLYNSDFHWSYSLEELKARFNEIYKLDRRLGKRAYFDAASGQMKFPYYKERGGDVPISPAFIQSVRLHVEEAIRMDYIDAIFFPDMGHAHILIPLKKWEDSYKNFPVSESTRLYEAFFQDPELKFAYHTAEQLRMLDDDKKLLPDRRLQWRFFSRNLVGDNRGMGKLELHQNPEHPYNTMSGADGYRWWGAGYDISANEKGCFAYVDKGEVRYFDLSLFPLEPAPGDSSSLYY